MPHPGEQSYDMRPQFLIELFATPASVRPEAAGNTRLRTIRFTSTFRGWQNPAYHRKVFWQFRQAFAICSSKCFTGSKMGGCDNALVFNEEWVVSVSKSHERLIPDNIVIHE